MYVGVFCLVYVKCDMIVWVGLIFWEYFGVIEGIVVFILFGDFDFKLGMVGCVGVNVLIIGEDDEEVLVGELGIIYFLILMFYEYFNLFEKMVEL